MILLVVEDDPVLGKAIQKGLMELPRMHLGAERSQRARRGEHSAF